MCGIVGIVCKEGRIEGKPIEAMVQALRIRGPDGSSVHLIDEGRVAIGHTRLAVIDLSDTGRQPMCNEDGSVWITFNGEIYNYRLLRGELAKEGHIFRSTSDTEVIIHAYEEWGPACVRRLRGIFAFGIWDSRSRELFLARDHVGVKPLYYWNSGKYFAFASQPKAFMDAPGFTPEVDLEAFSLYLSFGNVPADCSIYRGVRKLLPGHHALFRRNSLDTHRYWSLQYSPRILHKEEAQAAVAEKVRECVQVQSVSDVPVGTLLSGGIDSTIITALLSDKPVRALDTFTLGFEEGQSDERSFARLVADAYDTRHHEEVLTLRGVLSRLSAVIEAFDEPFHLDGLFPMYEVAHLVQGNGHKVVLGGDGGDELFAGYRWYDDFHRQMKQVRRLRHRLKLAWTGGVDDPLAVFFRYNGHLDEEQKQNFAGPAVCSAVQGGDPLWPLRLHWRADLPPVLAAQFLDFNCFLVDHCLYKVDRAAMACGVEVRVPFLDPELIELVFSIDHEIIFAGEDRKALLKDSLSDCLPRTMDLGRKKGFSSPLDTWLVRGLGEIGRSLTCDGSLCARGLLDADQLKNNFTQAPTGVQILLLAAELWSRRWLDNEPFDAKQLNRALASIPAGG